MAQRGQGNFELAAHFDYNSRGSADPRESLRRRRISKLALNAHKVLRHTDSQPPRLFFLTLISIFYGTCVKRLSVFSSARVCLSFSTSAGRSRRKGRYQVSVSVMYFWRKCLLVQEALLRLWRRSAPFTA